MSVFTKKYYRILIENKELFLVKEEATIENEWVRKLDEFGKFKLKKEIKSKKVKETYRKKFVKSTKNSIKKLRDSGVPVIIFKYKNNLFALENFPEEVRGLNIKAFKHMCANCERLSAAPDPKGCEKVRTKFANIEDFDFIEIGFQVINTLFNAFCVGKCKQYEEMKPKVVLSKEEKQALYLSIAQYMYAVDSYSEVKAIKGRNRMKYAKMDDYYS